eukprot:1464867-Pleurochrysis_carterae.AAC.6
MALAAALAVMMTAAVVTALAAAVAALAADCDGGCGGGCGRSGTGGGTGGGGSDCKAPGAPSRLRQLQIKVAVVAGTASRGRHHPKGKAVAARVAVGQGLVRAEEAAVDEFTLVLRKKGNGRARAELFK